MFAMFLYPVINCQGLSNLLGLLAVRLNELETVLIYTETVRTDGRTDVRTEGHVTITSEPKFLGLIVNQISLAMELRWRALPAGSAINQFYQLTQMQMRATRRMRTKATATITMINVPRGVAKSMALSQISVPLVELVGVAVVTGADVVGVTETKHI